jgi:hypothetical protein
MLIDSFWTATASRCCGFFVAALLIIVAGCSPAETKKDAPADTGSSTSQAGESSGGGTEVAEASIGGATVKVGDVFPELSGEDLYGKPLSIAEHKGKVILLDFFGDW